MSWIQSRNTWRLGAGLALALSILAGWNRVTQARAGDLDPSWNTDGIVTTEIPDGRGSAASSVVVQPDGKVVAGGLTRTEDGGLDFAVVRYHPDGSLDSDFGFNGVVLTDFAASGNPGGGDFISDLVLQPDGKIVAAGGAGMPSNLPISQRPPNAGDLDFALARYNPDGSLDESFGTDGLVKVDFSQIGAIDYIHAIALAEDGRIVAAGFMTTQRAGLESDFVLARFLPDGSLDTSFGNGGRVQVDLSGSDDQPLDVLLLPLGKILAVGSVRRMGGPLSDGDFALLQVLANGDVDANFGNNGRVFTNISTDPTGNKSADRAFAAALAPDGTILVAGQTSSTQLPLAGGMAVARYFADGTLDPAFGTGGIRVVETTSQFPNSVATARDLLVLQDGKIVLGGSAQVLRPFQGQLVVARLLPDGNLDSAFGREGMVLTDVPAFKGGLDALQALALQPDGKIVGAGIAQTDLEGDINFTAFGVVRYLGDLVEVRDPPKAGVPDPVVPPVAEFALSGSGCTVSTSPATPLADLGIWAALFLALTGIPFGHHTRTKASSGYPCSGPFLFI